METPQDVVKDPYLGYQPAQVAGWARACLSCPDPSPCTTACMQNLEIPAIVALAGRAACEGLALSRWFIPREQVEVARITDAIADCYNR